MVGSSPITVRRNKPNLFDPIYGDDYIAQVPKLLAVAAVPAVTVNWVGEPVSIEEWCGYIAQLTGLRPTFEYVEEGLSLVLDLTRMHELIGRTTVDWHAGIRRMIQARHPEVLK
jgi:UDP-glucuronate 4-epimerase